MDITMHGFWTMLHGMAFGGLYLLACSGALVALWMNFAHRIVPRNSAFVHEGEQVHSEHLWLRTYLLLMAVCAWAAVLTGTYMIYPWYRMPAPKGTTGAALAAYPRALLLSSPATAGWHSLGMEWKEHIAWFVPIAITMALVVVWRYGRELRLHRQLRAAVLGAVMFSLVAAGVAGFFGAMLTKFAPVQGGATVQLMRDAK